MEGDGEAGCLGLCDRKNIEAGGVGARGRGVGDGGAGGVVDLHGGPGKVGDLGGAEDEDEEEREGEGELDEGVAGFAGGQAVAERRA